MFVADGGKSVRSLLEPTQEPFRSEMHMYEKASELGTYGMWQLHIERTELQREYLEQWGSIPGLDALLCEPDACDGRRLPFFFLLPAADSSIRSHDAIYICRARQIQICRLYWRLQRCRLRRCILSLRRKG